MSRPIAVFRYRKRFFRRALRETLGGLGIALLFSVVPYLFRERVWPLLALFLGLIVAVAACLVFARRRETGTIALYETKSSGRTNGVAAKRRTTIASPK